MAVKSELTKTTSKQTESKPNKDITMLRRQLYRYCEFLSSSEHDAEDLVQTTLLKALPVLQGKKHHANLPALLRRIAKNTWLDEVRKQGHYNLFEPEDLQRFVSVDLEDNLALKDALQTLMYSLTSQQRATILLCDAFQYTDGEVAEMLGVTRGAIKATLHRARLRLHGLREGIESASVMDESQKCILEAYVSAFQSADIRMLLELCKDGLVDPVLATSKVLTFAKKQVGQSNATIGMRPSMLLAA